MTTSASSQLARLIRERRESLLSQWRERVRQLPSATYLDIPTLTDHMPPLLDELANSLERGTEKKFGNHLEQTSPATHGLQRLHVGFDIEEVVAEYNILRACVQDLAEVENIQLQGQPFHIIHDVFDEAVILAVQVYATERALDLQRRREEYLAFVAHDLRTPLNAIALAAKVLDHILHERGEGAETTLMMKTLHRNVRQLEGLVANILKENVNIETEAGIKMERRYFDLWPLVELLIHDLHPVAGTASTQLYNRVPDELMVFADAALLRRVFQNLIANAIAHTPRGEIVIGAQLSEGWVECWVTDTGSGIPVDRIEKIFDKFETESPTDGAMGLGLTIVKTFVEAHGGTVSVTSTQDAGSTFTFTLPLKDDA